MQIKLNFTIADSTGIVKVTLCSLPQHHQKHLSIHFGQVHELRGISLTTYLVLCCIGL